MTPPEELASLLMQHPELIEKVVAKSTDGKICVFATVTVWLKESYMRQGGIPHPTWCKIFRPERVCTCGNGNDQIEQKANAVALPVPEDDGEFHQW